MKVKKLLALLKNSNQDADIILSSDAEGNSYANLYSVEQALNNTKLVLTPRHEFIDGEELMTEEEKKKVIKMLDALQEEERKRTDEKVIATM